MKYALIIGNDKYSDPRLAQLKTPASDSQALARALADQNIGAFDDVKPLINKTETEVRHAIGEFLTNKRPDDLVLIYFSGHGILDDRGRLYLSLKDTQTSLLKATAIPSSYVSDEMDSCRSKRQVLILDCCHSGAFARGTKGEQKAVTEATFEGSGYGRVVMTASDSTQYALEGDQVIEGTNLSLFTHFLLEGLKTGGADLDNDGHVSLDEWYDYTYTHVIAETPRQVPHKWSYNQQGDVVIARNPFLKKKRVELPIELLHALESSFVGIRESAVAELGKYLGSRDPEMVHLAVASLEKMRGDDSRRISSLAEKLLSELAHAQSPKAEAASVSPSNNDAGVMPKANDSPKVIREAAWAHSERSNRDSARGSPKTDLGGTFWGKWSGVLFVEIACFALVFAYRYEEYTYLFSGIVSGLAALAQWFFFRMYLKPWWIVANVAAGFSLGALHKFLIENTDWSREQLGIILALWGIGNFLLALLLIRDARLGPPQLFPTSESGTRQNISLTFFSASLLIGVISIVLLVWDLSYETLRVTWMLYAAVAILTGISFFLRNDVPRNIGFITLALFLAFDGINVALLAFDSAYPPYFFALNGMVGLLPGIFFAFHKATWKNLGFSLLVGYLISNSIAGLTIYNSDLSAIFLILSSVFAIPAAAIFLVRK